MATPPRVFDENSYYHIYNRGNRKQQIFLHDGDYWRFLGKLIEYKKKYPVEILAFCLMPNHFHFLIRQQAPQAISKLFSSLSNSHSKYFNIKYETVGSLFQGRFKDKRVNEDQYLVHLSRYIHLNPLGLLSFLGDETFNQLKNYKWSSLPAYLLGKDDDITNAKLILDYFSGKDQKADYEDFLKAGIKLEVEPLVSDLLLE